MHITPFLTLLHPRAPLGLNHLSFQQNGMTFTMLRIQKIIIAVHRYKYLNEWRKKSKFNVKTYHSFSFSWLYNLALPIAAQLTGTQKIYKQHATIWKLFVFIRLYSITKPSKWIKFASSRRLDSWRRIQIRMWNVSYLWSGKIYAGKYFSKWFWSFPMGINLIKFVLKYEIIRFKFF